MRRHLTRCLVAGAVALLPIAGTVATLVWLEAQVCAWGLNRLAWYFPGLGLLAGLLAVYLLGLATTTLVGRWLMRRFDALVARLPALGRLYDGCKQLIGLPTAGKEVFQGVVLVPAAGGGRELGLITREAEGELTVFVPGSPNPANGRLVLIEATRVQRLSLPVSEALSALLLLGAGPDEPPQSVR